MARHTKDEKALTRGRIEIVVTQMQVKEFVDFVALEGSNSVPYGGLIKSPKIIRGLLEPIYTLEELQVELRPVTILFEVCQINGKHVDWINGSKNVESVCVDGTFVASDSSARKEIARLNAASEALINLSGSMDTKITTVVTIDVQVVKSKFVFEETWVLPTHKYVGGNAKNVGKGYPDVQNDVGKNVGGNASREAFPTPNWYGVGKAFPDAVRCVDIDGVGKTLFPTPCDASENRLSRRREMRRHRRRRENLIPDAAHGVGKAYFPTGFPDAVPRRREIPQNASGKGDFPTLIKPLFPTFHAASGKTPIPDASPDALCTASGKAPFPDVLLPTPSCASGKIVFPTHLPTHC
ncbi:ribonuclease 3-like protein 2 [Cucumis melo var. makuwa]|uniref:Ribonuclease 3-like protein 2 n=1 Tax=Cucumis melo var. makuwa TaxID=1194695 RepID=A0A5D3BU43_CUCMM|nr:ribonuclease 3-like protein 2 [Cucumis melo var. makuwa]